MAAPKNKKINLLVQEGFEHSQIGKVLSWLLSAGRAIVIVTELVVITAFLSRFWLDRQLTDLLEENQAKKAQVEASATFEKDLRDLQARLTAVKEFEQIKLSPTAYVREITKTLSAEVVLTDISYSEGVFSVSGTSLNEAGIAGLIKNLEPSEKFSNVSLASISLDKNTTNLIKFSLRLEEEKKN